MLLETPGWYHSAYRSQPRFSRMVTQCEIPVRQAKGHAGRRTMVPLPPSSLLPTVEQSRPPTNKPSQQLLTAEGGGHR